MRKYLLKLTSITGFVFSIVPLYVWLCVSSLVLVFVYNISQSVENLYWIKDIVIYVYVAVISFRLMKRKLTYSLVLSFLLLVVYVLYMAEVSDVPILLKGASIRQLMSPTILFLAGFLGIRSGRDLQLFSKTIVLIGVCLGLFGLVERFSYLWTYIDLSSYFGIKNVAVGSTGYPAMFIEPISTFFKESIPVGGIVRMVSTLLDPINLGHTFVFLFSIVLFDRHVTGSRATRSLLLLFFSVCILLTLSKGAIFQVALLVLVYHKAIRLPLKVVGISIVIAILFYLYVYHPGIILHTSGTISSFSTISLFGMGLGKAGNYSTLLGKGISANGIGDSFIGSIVGQIGLFGLLLWLASTLFMVKRRMPLFLKGVLYTQLFVALFSENAFNLLSIFTLFIYLGAVYYLTPSNRDFISNEDTAQKAEQNKVFAN